MAQRRARGRMPALLFSANSTAEFRDNLLRGFDRGGVLVDIERDGADARVTSAAVALANAGKVYIRLLRSPGVRSHGNFDAEAALAQTHAVNGLGMEIVGDKFVVALEIVVGDVEEDGAVL